MNKIILALLALTAITATVVVINKNFVKRDIDGIEQHIKSAFENFKKDFQREYALLGLEK
jgi:hypothetical protein